MSQQLVSRRLFSAVLGSSVLGASVFSGATTVWAGMPVMYTEDALWRGLEFQDQTGRSFQISEHSDTGASLTLMKLWAHWCPACLSEMVALTALSAALGPRCLEVLLVSHPEYWAQDVAFAQRRGLPFRLATPSLANGAGVVRAALTQGGAYAVPRSFVFRRRDGSMAWRREGSIDWASSGTIATMKSLIG